MGFTPLQVRAKLIFAPHLELSAVANSTHFCKQAGYFFQQSQFLGQDYEKEGDNLTRI